MTNNGNVKKEKLIVGWTSDHRFCDFLPLITKINKIYALALPG